MSEASLAAKVGMELARLADLEAGVARPSAIEFYEIARALGTSISYFFENLAPR